MEWSQDEYDKDVYSQAKVSESPKALLTKSGLHVKD